MPYDIEDQTASNPLKRIITPFNASSNASRVPQRLAGYDAGPAPQLNTLQVMDGPGLRLGPPAPQTVRLMDPARDATQQRIQQEGSEYKRLLDNGSGVYQLLHPTDGSQPGGLRRLGGVAAKIGDVALSVLAPGIAQFTPGTTLNHQRLLNQASGRLSDDLGFEQRQAQTRQEDALTAYTSQRPGIEQSKIDQRQQAVQQRIMQQAAQRGQQATFDTDGVPTFTDNPELQAYHTAAATALLHEANAEKANVYSTIAKNKYVPGTPEYVEQMRKLSQIDRKIAIANGNLGIRHAEYNMHAYGTDASGQNELPGVLHDEDGRPVGSVQAQNVKPTTGQRDAAGRADSMQDIGTRIREQLKDPEIVSYLGPMRGRVSSIQGDAGMLPDKVAKFRNDLISYGAFQAGLHPVRGIGALHYFDQVMGGLGQTPDELMGKLNSNDETAASVEKRGAMPTVAGQRRVNNTTPNKTGAGGTIPAAAAAQLREGVEHTFGNGQVWTKQNGKPVRVR